MLFSIKMRAARGGPHEHGGQHISGAERLVNQEQAVVVSAQMIERALSHSRGKPDFINLKLQSVSKSDVTEVSLLRIEMVNTTNVGESRKVAVSELIHAGVKPTAAKCGLDKLLGLSASMRGAMLLCAKCGKRIDKTAQKGIRVSRMDAADDKAFRNYLQKLTGNTEHLREAVVLASKVAAGPGMVAELCWSDDPDYTTGYVASSRGYVRIPNCKEHGSGLGGRVFFVKPGTNVQKLVDFLEHQPVLVKLTQECR